MEERVHWKVHLFGGKCTKEQLVVSYLRVRHLERYAENYMQQLLNFPLFFVSFFKTLKGSILYAKNCMLIQILEPFQRN